MLEVNLPLVVKDLLDAVVDGVDVDVEKAPKTTTQQLQLLFLETQVSAGRFLISLEGSPSAAEFSFIQWRVCLYTTEFSFSPLHLSQGSFLFLFCMDGVEWILHTKMGVSKAKVSDGMLDWENTLGLMD